MAYRAKRHDIWCGQCRFHFVYILSKLSYASILTQNSGSGLSDPEMVQRIARGFWNRQGLAIPKMCLVFWGDF